jgi:hypothetical protein
MWKPHRKKNEMITRIIPYTEKFPFMYQAILPGYIIETTNKAYFDKLIPMLNGIINYLDLPASKRIQIECACTVRKSS